MSKKAPQRFIAGERQAVAIQRIMKISHALSNNAFETIKLMREMTELLVDLQGTDNDPEIQKLIDRLRELGYLENQQEFQSWSITVGHVMDRAWKRLP